MMKKIAIIILALALVLAGCSEKTGSTNTVDTDSAKKIEGDDVDRVDVSTCFYKDAVFLDYLWEGGIHNGLTSDGNISSGIVRWEKDVAEFIPIPGMTDIQICRTEDLETPEWLLLKSLHGRLAIINNEGSWRYVTDSCRGGAAFVSGSTAVFFVDTKRNLMRYDIAEFTASKIDENVVLLTHDIYEKTNGDQFWVPKQ